MAKRPQAALRVNQRRFDTDCLLPERAAHDSKAIWLDLADADEAKLRIGPAYDDRRAVLQASFRCGLRVDEAELRSRLAHRWQYLRREAAQRDDLLRPGAPRQVEHTRTGPCGRVGDELTAELEEYPIAQHREVCDALKNLRFVFLQPEQARGRRDRHPVAAGEVDLLGQLALHQFSRLLSSA